MLTRLYPISLDTYSISDAQVYCCNVLHRLDIASHSHADSPALLFSAHTIDIALLCSDIPTSGLFLLPNLSFHTLPKHTLPALLCTSLMNSFLWESTFCPHPHLVLVDGEHVKILDGMPLSSNIVAQQCSIIAAGEDCYYLFYPESACIMKLAPLN